MKHGDWVNALRLQNGVLSAAERACLIWLGRRAPKWITPDHLTSLGLAAMCLAGVCGVAARWWPPALVGVVVCLALNWLGDSLDGTLARLRDRQRPRYGFYVDHMVDAFGTLALLSGLGLSGYMSERVALAVMICYFLMSINVYLATYTMGTFQMSFLRVGPTELRILLAIGILFAYVRPRVNLLGGEYLWFDVAGTVAVVMMTLVLLVSVAANTRALFRLERLDG